MSRAVTIGRLVDSAACNTGNEHSGKCEAMKISMKAIAWPVTAAIGFALMAWSHFNYQRVDTANPWSYGRIYVAGANADVDVKPVEFEHTTARIRLLPRTEFAKAVLEGVTGADPAKGKLLALQLREKLILLSPVVAGIDEGLLVRGRLPVAGRNEVIAGSQAAKINELTVAGRTLKVVGVMRRDVALLVDSYLIPPHDALSDLFDLKDESVRETVLVRLTKREFHDRQTRKRLKASFPAENFAVDVPVVRTERGPFYLYQAGLTLLLLGGSGFLIRLYRVLEKWIRWPPLHDSLAVLSRRRRLLWTMHLGYFGLVAVTGFFVYDLPALQNVLMGPIRSEAMSGDGLLGTAAKAYGSGNMLYAALLTFLINFFVGSVAMITLPSFVLPGVGVLLAAVRALGWGLLLAPTSIVLSSAMLPHSWTMLLEGEGFILAAFFAVLIPVSLCERSAGDGLWDRYRQVLLVNLKGNLLVAIVLLTAACYEAVEVIIMSRL